MPENGYTVTQIDELSVLDAARNPVQGVRVWFEFGEGQRGHVDIPMTLATADRRDSMIQAYIDKVNRLWG